MSIPRMRRETTETSPSASLIGRSSSGIVFNARLFVGDHAIEAVDVVFIELDLVDPVAMFFKLSEVLQSTRCACIAFREKV